MPYQSLSTTSRPETYPPAPLRSLNDAPPLSRWNYQARDTYCGQDSTLHSESVLCHGTPSPSDRVYYFLSPTPESPTATLQNLTLAAPQQDSPPSPYYQNHQLCYSYSHVGERFLSICGVEFERVSSKDKVFKCTWKTCPRAFKRLEHLRRHEKTHTGEKEYVCDIKGCGKSFSRGDNLKAHRRRHFAQLLGGPGSGSRSVQVASLR